MVEIISIVLLVAILIGLKIVLGVSIKKMNELSQKSTLDEITKRLPDSIQMGKEMLAMLKNDSVKIEKSTDEKSGTSLYLVMENKIIIANGNGSYAGVQTMAHECLHSVQNKKMLWFNFIYSNCYIIYTLAVIILTVLDVIKNTTMQLYILTLLGFVFYAFRSYLETDAMIKAEYLAKEYMEETDKLTKEEIEIIIKNYKKVNQKGIQIVNFSLLISVISKVVIYEILSQWGRSFL